MCGIFGIFGKNEYIKNQRINLLFKSIEHRGNDSNGLLLINSHSNRTLLLNNNFHNANKVNFNYNILYLFSRLSIRDLSINANQPFLSKDKKFSLAYNGEIYNILELKNALKKYQIQFKTTSDTEVLFYCLIHLGVEYTLKIIDGMFAFCFTDLLKNKAYLCKDHAGIKPLFYYEENDYFYYSSEINSFLFIESFKKKLDLQKVGDYFLNPYYLHEVNLLENVKSLQSGSFLELDLKNYNKSISCYYTLPNFNKNKSLITFQEFKTELQSNLKEQIISDVSYSLQLSGGLDSYLLYRELINLSENFMTFSINVKDSIHSEKKDILNNIKVKNNYNYIFDYNMSDFEIHSYELSKYLGSPILHPNTTPLFFLGKKAHELGTKVILSGDGLDELAGGYSRYLRSAFPNILKNFSKIINIGKFKKIFSDKDFLINFLLIDEPKKIDNLKLFFPTINFDDLLNKKHQEFSQINGDSLNEKLLNYDFKYFLPAALRRQDSAFMANNIENRVPYLSKKFINFYRNNITLNDSINFKNTFISYNKNTKKFIKKYAHWDNTKLNFFKAKKGFSLNLNNYYFSYFDKIKKSDLNDILKIDLKKNYNNLSNNNLIKQIYFLDLYIKANKF